MLELVKQRQDKQHQEQNMLQKEKASQKKKERLDMEKEALVKVQLSVVDALLWQPMDLSMWQV